MERHARTINATAKLSPRMEVALQGISATYTLMHAKEYRVEMGENVRRRGSAFSVTAPRLQNRSIFLISKGDATGAQLLTFAKM
jgi:hypothetical protein